MSSLSFSLGHQDEGGSATTHRVMDYIDQMSEQPHGKRVPQRVAQPTADFREGNKM